ncbi:MAG: SpoIIIAH-like family protein [Oscillospiraceae bacterium]|jgi:stage III sporulation protein AH|nr:SpoIIIAH-like family protein [Oscillospiraceae bacterium]
MKVWKRNAVVLTVILFVCVALYLSWSYNQEDLTGDDPLSAYIDGAVDPSGLDAAGGGDPLGDLSVILDPGNAEPAGGAGDPAVDVKTEDSGYFSATRLSRQKARDSTLAILKEAADRTGNAQEVRDKAVSDIEALAAATMSEARIESLVIAKGFADCVAFIGADGVDVVVAEPAGGLLASDVAKIKDIVLQETKLSVDGIHIIPAKV